MLNLGHRGFSGRYPENTMLAFRKAAEAGAHGVELDVQFTKDSELVIIHDESVDRTTDGRGLVRDFTLKEIKELDASASFRGIYGINRIPTLREYFEFAKSTDGFITNIELKTGIYEYPGIEKAVAEMIKEFGLEDRIIISSFNYFSVLRFKQICPGIKCGFLEESRIADFGKYTKSYGVECVHPMHWNMTPEAVEEIKANGIEINTWTVNDLDEVERLYGLGVESVIGNFPDMVAGFLSKRSDAV